MQWHEGNIIVWWKLGKTIVFPTNAGYKYDGANVMGAGLALEMSKLIPDLPHIYGKSCMELKPHQHLKTHHLILVPSKPLNKEYPHLSWKQDADPITVKTSLEWLQNNANEFPEPVYVPILGAGVGRLDKDAIVNLMDKILKDKKFIGVLW